MTAEQIGSILWRRRTLFAVSFVLCLILVAAVTWSLPKTYNSAATLYVGVSPKVDEALAVDVSVGEQLARTYTALAANPNVADEVVTRLGPDSPSQSELLAKMSFTPVERTQLLEIGASDQSPEGAQELADVYASTFAHRVRKQFRQGETQTSVAINEPAVFPTRAASPNVPLYLGLGAVLSGFIALAIVLVRERLDDGTPVADEGGTVLGVPVVGRIPRVPRGHEPGSGASFADAFRLLKANVDFLSERPPGVVAVTSPDSMAGKTTVATQLAIAAADDGEEVVLVEADLRRSGLAKTGIAATDPHTPGLTNYIAGGVTVRQVLVPAVRHGGLQVIVSGPTPRNPSSLLRSRRFRFLIKQLRTSYDRVIIDTPPISVGADASIIVTQADATLCVVDARRTKRSHAEAGLAQLNTARARHIGVVLNQEPRSPLGDYYVTNGRAQTTPPAPSREAVRHVRPFRTS